MDNTQNSITHSALQSFTYRLPNSVIWINLVLSLRWQTKLRATCPIQISTVCLIFKSQWIEPMEPARLFSIVKKVAIRFFKIKWYQFCNRKYFLFLKFLIQSLKQSSGRSENIHITWKYGQPMWYCTPNQPTCYVLRVKHAVHIKCNVWLQWRLLTKYLLWIFLILHVIAKTENQFENQIDKMKSK